MLSNKMRRIYLFEVCRNEDSTIFGVKIMKFCKLIFYALVVTVILGGKILKRLSDVLNHNELKELQ